jgi:hypothetical protein
MEESMKRQLTIILALLLFLAAAFLIMSCGSAPQNSNVTANANRPLNSTESDEVKIADADDPCGEPVSSEKLKKLKKALEAKVAGDNTGSNQLSQQYNRNFYLEFAEGTGDEAGWVIAYVSGAIQGERKFKKLADFIEDFVKGDCKIKVVYKAKVVAEAKYPPAGFEWCESPMMACPGGYCALSCDFKTSNPVTLESANSNANSNSQTNANVNARSNNNVNRP